MKDIDETIITSIMIIFGKLARFLQVDVSTNVHGIWPIAVQFAYAFWPFQNIVGIERCHTYQTADTKICGVCLYITWVFLLGGDYVSTVTPAFPSICITKRNTLRITMNCSYVHGHYLLFHSDDVR